MFPFNKLILNFVIFLKLELLRRGIIGAQAAGDSEELGASVEGHSDGLRNWGAKVDGADVQSVTAAVQGGVLH